MALRHELSLKSLRFAARRPAAHGVNLAGSLRPDFAAPIRVALVGLNAQVVPELSWRECVIEVQPKASLMISIPPFRKPRERAGAPICVREKERSRTDAFDGIHKCSRRLWISPDKKHIPGPAAVMTVSCIVNFGAETELVPILVDSPGQAVIQ
jgi:hypothetical protein